jgi:Glycosyl transferase family 11
MLCGQFMPSAGMVVGIRRAVIRQRATVVPEPERLDAIPTDGFGSGLQIVRFRGIHPAFAPLEGWDERIRAELIASMRAREGRLAARTSGSIIGVHVRRGDFYAASEADLASWEASHGAMQTPISWFVKSVILVRRLLGRSASVFVVSDGDPDELRPLLMLDDVTLLRGGSPISDMIALSNAQVLIGSMESSFTAWASFLGQMTTCTFPAPTPPFPYVNRRDSYTGSLDPDAPPEDLVRDLGRLRP